MSQWCKGFWMMSFTSKKGYKRRIQEWVGVSRSQVLSMRSYGLSLPPQEYFGASQHQVSQEFLHPSQIMCSVLYFYHGCVPLDELDICLYQPALLVWLPKLLCPAIKTGVSDNKDCLPYWSQWRFAEMDWGVPNLTSAHDSLVASLGGLKKRW